MHDRLRIVRWVIALMLLSCPLVTWAEPADDLAGFSEHLTTLAERCRAATVGIAMPGGGTGSGVIISADGLVLTAAHVLPEVGGEIIIVLHDGRQVPAQALGVNRGADSGMARITEPGPYPFVHVSRDESIWEGDWCLAFGHAAGIQSDRPAPLRLGRILHVSSHTAPTRWITTDSTVVSGDSGGPLFNLNGNVIGIHSNIGMSVLVNRHVPIDAYHAQWDRLLEPTEINQPPAAPEPPVPGLESLPGAIARDLAKRLLDGDEALQEKLDSLRDETGKIVLSPEQAAALMGREDLLESIRAYQQKVAERAARSEQIEQAGMDPESDDEESEVSRLSRETRLLIIEKKRERMLGEIAEDLRKTHGKIAEHVLSRFDPAASAGACTVEVVSRGRVVALGTIVRSDGYIVTKASELAGPTRVRLLGQELPARIVNGEGANDLVLLKVDAQGLTPVRWAKEPASLGSLIVVPSADNTPIALGAVGVRHRPIPQRVNHTQVVFPGRPYLGLNQLESLEGIGVKIGEVISQAPADRAGLRADDIITAVQGDAVDHLDAIIEALDKSSVGQVLTLTIQREDQTLEIDVTLGERPEEPSPEEADDRQSAAQVYSARGGNLSERRTGFPLAFQHDAVVWATDIGGPVLNLDGEAVGINIARYGRTATYAIPAEQAKQVVDQMMRGR